MRKIKWYVSPLLVAMLAALVLLGYFYDCVIYLTTIVLHELAHAEASIRLGYTLDRFVLMPYGAALKGDFEGVRPRDEIIIAVTGPLFNASVAVICVALWWIYPPIYVFTDRLVAANIFTAAFNLLPVFPLDGGRALLAALSVRLPRQKAYRRMRIFGYIFAPVFAIFFVLVAVFGGGVNFSFALAGAFILFATVLPDKNSVYRRVYSMAYFSERLGRGLKVVEIMVPDSLSLIKLDRMLNSNYYTSFIIVDEKMNRLGVVSETRLEELCKKFSPDEKVGDVYRKSAPDGTDFTSYKE